VPAGLAIFQYPPPGYGKPGIGRQRITICLRHPLPVFDGGSRTGGFGLALGGQRAAQVSVFIEEKADTEKSDNFKKIRFFTFSKIFRVLHLIYFILIDRFDLSDVELDHLECGLQGALGSGGVWMVFQQTHS